MRSVRFSHHTFAIVSMRLGELFANRRERDRARELFVGAFMLERNP